MIRRIGFMKPYLLGFGLIVLLNACRQETGSTAAPRPAAGRRTFQVRGVLQEINPDGASVVIKHQAIPNYMGAMTMPFRVRDTTLTGFARGDEVTFRLCVTENESWIDRLTKTGHVALPPGPASTIPPTNAPVSFRLADIPDFALTNEFGRPVSLHQFQGKAVALTFFFTRCPIPEFCPRLSRNFAEASAKLNALTNGPKNYHFLSVSFDPQDRPPILQAYARQYHYDSNSWSLLTGDPAQIRELTQGFGLTFTNDGMFYNHNFRTVVFDARGRLHTMWPFGGDTSDLLVKEILKAAAVTN